MPTRKPKQSSSIKSLDDAEWDFRSVPAEEIEACFWWEYCRESEEISADIIRVARGWHDTDDTAKDNELNESLLLSADSIRLLGRDILRTFVWMAVRGNFTKPWQALPKRIKDIIAGETVYSTDSAGLKTVSAVHLGMIKSMTPAAAWIVADEAAIAQDAAHAEIEKRPDWKVISVPMVKMCGGGRRGPGHQFRALAITVNWRMSDTDIAAVLGEWLKRNRPDEFTENKHRHLVAPDNSYVVNAGGERVDPKKALEWLGFGRMYKAFGSWGDVGKFLGSLSAEGDIRKLALKSERIMKALEEMVTETN